MSWYIQLHGMPNLAIQCLEVIRFLALETANYMMLSNEQRKRVEVLVYDSISVLRVCHCTLSPAVGFHKAKLADASQWTTSRRLWLE